MRLLGTCNATFGPHLKQEDLSPGREWVPLSMMRRLQGPFSCQEKSKSTHRHGMATVSWRSNSLPCTEALCIVLRCSRQTMQSMVAQLLDLVKCRANIAPYSPRKRYAEYFGYLNRHARFTISSKVGSRFARKGCSPTIALSVHHVPPAQRNPSVDRSPCHQERCTQICRGQRRQIFHVGSSSRPQAQRRI